MKMKKLTIGQKYKSNSRSHGRRRNIKLIGERFLSGNTIILIIMCIAPPYLSNFGSGQMYHKPNTSIS